MSIPNKELTLIINFIEENLRASNNAGIDFIDAKNIRDRISRNQNHVIFGRRGAGKSCLLTSINKTEDKLLVRINIEDFKQISYPNIILHVLKACFEQINEYLKGKFPFRSYLIRKKLSNEIRDLSLAMYEPDDIEENIKDLNETEFIKEGFFRNKLSGFGGKKSKRKGSEISKQISKSKLDQLLLNLPRYKSLFSKIAKAINNSSIFLILDDFYFLGKKDQPNFLDYFHRLTKDSNLFLKIATIKHRTKLYTQDSESYIGVELGHDVLDVDLDYTLDKFEDLKNFMLKLLDEVANICDVKINFLNLFSGEGFTQLCLASGGVPRDFLSLFVKLASSLLTNELETIGKMNVNEAAISNRDNKFQSFKTDSASEREVLEAYLNKIKSFVYDEKRTNAFLIAKPDLDANPVERQAIKELVDLRLLHIIDSNTSKAPSDGRRYEAYLLDVGLYENSRPRNFKQIEPGTKDEKSRKDDLRASPFLELKKLASSVQNESIQFELELSKE